MKDTDNSEKLVETILANVEMMRKNAEEMRIWPRGMGFCFGYWSAKRGVLAKRGIEWRDPHQMNPRVLFD